MLTSIFNKSKPVNFIIIASLVVVSFVFYSFHNIDKADFSFSSIFLPPLIVLFYVFLTDFVISKNDLTKKNSYGIMIFGITTLIFPEVFSNINFLIANLLVLFALRRLFSLRSKRAPSKKFFDAVFWISLASLFYSWVLLYSILVVVALANYWQSEIKYVIVSIFGMLTVFLLLIIYNILVNDAYFFLTNFSLDFSLNFSAYNTPWKILRLTIILSIFLWSVLFFIKLITTLSRKQKPVYIIIILSAFIGLTLALLAPEKTGSEFVFFIIPFSIIVANYIETVNEKWFREVLILLLLMVPISKLFL